MNNKKEEFALASDIEGLRKDIEAIAEGQARTEYILLEKLEKVAMKEDIGRLATAILKNEQDIQRLEANMATKKDVQGILNHIDAFTKKVTVIQSAI